MPEFGLEHETEMDIELEMQNENYIVQAGPVSQRHGVANFCVALVRNAEVGAKFDNSWSQEGITEYMALDCVMMAIQSANPSGTSGLFICIQTCLSSPLPG